MLDKMLDKPVLYPKAYRWAIVAALLDIFCTYIILVSGGVELNGIARRVIDAGGVPGMIAFKFAIVSMVFIICEYIGRQQHDTGRRLAVAAVALNSFPVVVGASQLGLRELGHL